MADNAKLNDPTARSAPPSLPVAVLQAQMRDIAAQLERAGVSHAVMLGAGFVLGIGACAGLAMHANFIALGMLVTSRLFFLLTSHATYRSSAAAALDPILAKIALALMPFGFALARIRAMLSPPVLQCWGCWSKPLRSRRHARRAPRTVVKAMRAYGQRRPLCVFGVADDGCSMH